MDSQGKLNKNGKEPSYAQAEDEAAEDGGNGGVRRLVGLLRAKPVADEDAGARADHGIKGEDHAQQLIRGSDRRHGVVGILAQDQRVYRSHGIGQQGFHEEGKKNREQGQRSLRGIDAAQIPVIQPDTW